MRKIKIIKLTCKSWFSLNKKTARFYFNNIHTIYFN